MTEDEAMHIDVICVGKLKEKYWRDAVDEYAKRLGRYCSFSVIERKETRLPANPSPADEEDVKKAESKAVLDAVKDGSYVIALDVQGRQYDSPALAEFLEDRMNRGTGRIAFLIGGSLGLSREALASADMRLSFSKMTFPHQLMRVILSEQIYRCFKIIRGETYHK